MITVKPKPTAELLEDLMTAQLRYGLDSDEAKAAKALIDAATKAATKPAANARTDGELLIAAAVSERPRLVVQHLGGFRETKAAQRLAEVAESLDYPLARFNGINRPAYAEMIALAREVAADWNQRQDMDGWAA